MERYRLGEDSCGLGRCSIFGVLGFLMTQTLPFQEDVPVDEFVEGHAWSRPEVEGARAVGINTRGCCADICQGTHQGMHC